MLVVAADTHNALEVVEVVADMWVGDMALEGKQKCCWNKLDYLWELVGDWGSQVLAVDFGLKEKSIDMLKVLVVDSYVQGIGEGRSWNMIENLK